MRNLLGTMTAAALLVMGACSDETLIFPGGPAGPPVALSVSSGDLVLQVGGTTSVGAAVEDDAGNPTATAATFTSRNTAVATVAAGTGTEAFPSVATITAAGVGSTVIDVAGGGFTDSIRVTIGPTGIVIVGPDSVRSAETSEYTIEMYDAGGNLVSGTVPITWMSTNRSLAVVSPEGNALSQGPLGSFLVQARTPGGASAELNVRVVPSDFDGTLANAQGGGATADFADTLIITPGSVPWDGDEFVTIGGVNPWLVERTTDQITVLVPAAAVGTAPVVVGNQGPNQIFGAADLTVTSTFTNNTGGFPGPDISEGPFPMEFFISLKRDPANSPFGTESSFYLLDQSTDLDLDITVTMSWQTIDQQWNDIEDADENSDHDILFVNCAFTAFTNTDGASFNNPEEASVTVPATECWIMWLNFFAEVRNDLMLKLTITSP